MIKSVKMMALAALILGSGMNVSDPSPVPDWVVQANTKEDADKFFEEGLSISPRPSRMIA